MSSEPAKKEARAPAVPRPAATILLLRDTPFEVLMIRRHHQQEFASALVFPGGLVDDSDASDEWLPHVVGAERFSVEERALRIAAFRETFEESALLLVRDEDGNVLPHPSGRHDDFRQIVVASGGRLWLEELIHFGHWVTPDQAPKRFDTHFFLAVAPGEQEARIDGSEAVALEWLAPGEAIARAVAGESSILFPTHMNLRLLAESADAESALASARARPVFSVYPRIEKREGGVAVVIPAEAGYGVTENFHPHEPK